MAEEHSGDSTLRPDIATVVSQHLADVLELRPEDVDLEARLTELPSVDSLRLVEAIVSLEQSLDLRLSEDELFDVRTGVDLCHLVEATLVNRAGPTQ